MPEVSPGDLALLRTQPHRTNLFMIVQKPQSVLTALVNDGDIARGERVITFDGAAYAGGIWVDFTDLEPGMTVWIGSAAGLCDKGEVRLRSATATTLTVSENWEIEWADDLHLTVKKEWRLWPRQPRQVPTDGTVDWYIDYDEAYDDENLEFRPVPILGPHRVVFMAAGSATIVYDWTDSYAVKSGRAIASYLVAAESGTPDNAASGTPTVTWAAASGHKGYLIKVTVTDDNPDPQSETGYRFAFVMDRTGANAPYQSFDMRSCGGSWADGGWKASFVVRETDVTETEFPDGSLVVVFAEDWYGATKDSIGGNTVGAENIIFVGNIVRDSVRFDAFRQEVIFEAQGMAGEMSDCECDASVLEDATTPSDWYEIDNATADHLALFHARYMSNLLQIADFFVSGDTREAVFWEVPQASLFEQLNTHIYDDAIFARVAADRMGRLWAEVDLQMISASDRGGIATVMEITEPDRRDLVQLAHPMAPQISRVETSGVYYAGGGAAAVAYLSGSPGPSRLRRGRVATSSNLALASQAQCNNLAGWLLAKENNPYPQVRISLAGNYRVFDVVPQEYVTLSLAPADNNRGLEWTTERMIPRAISFRWRANDGLLMSEISCEKYAIGPVGQTIIPPDDPDNEWPIKPPPIDGPPIDPPPPPGGWRNHVYAGTRSKGFYRTSDFAAANPTWVQDNSGLGSLAVQCACADPWDPSHYRYAIAGDEAYRMYTATPGAAGAWTKVLSKATAVAMTALTDTATLRMGGISGNINIQNRVYVSVAGLSTDTYKLYLFKSIDQGANWTASLVYTSASLKYATIGAPVVGAMKGSSAYTPGYVIYIPWIIGIYDNPWISVSVNEGTSWSEVNLDGYSDYIPRVERDPSDQSRAYIGVYGSTGDPVVDGINVGQSCIIRGSWVGNQRTNISSLGQAAAAGVLTRVLLYPGTLAALPFYFGVFYTTNGNTLKCRSAQYLGNVGGLAQCYTVNLDPPLEIEVGDYIGFYSPNALGRVCRSGGASMRWWLAGNHCIEGNEAAYNPASDGANFSLSTVGDIQGGEAGIRLMLSDDHGATWALISGANELMIADDPACPGSMRIDISNNSFLRVAYGDKLWKSLTGGASWTWRDLSIAGLDILSFLQDEPNKVYLGKSVSASAGSPHVIFVSSQDGLNLAGKSGANAHVADTGGGDSIPYNCGGVAVEGILQVWSH